MPRILHSVNLSEIQSKLLLVVKIAETPEMAFEELSKQAPETSGNIAGARDVLIKLGMIEVTDNQVLVTSKGEEIMRDEYLIDEMGEPTEKGEALLQTGQKKVQPGPSGPTDNAEPGPTPGPMASGGGEAETSPGDGFPAETSIFVQVHDLSKILKG